jgi:hypothetical protein
MVEWNCLLHGGWEAEKERQKSREGLRYQGQDIILQSKPPGTYFFQIGPISSLLIKLWTHQWVILLMRLHPYDPVNSQQCHQLGSKSSACEPFGTVNIQVITLTYYTPWMVNVLSPTLELPCLSLSLIFVYSIIKLKFI